MKLRREVTPAPFSDAPTNTGTTEFLARPSLRPLLISSSLRVPSSKYFSIRSSAPSAAFSISSSLYFSTVSAISAGIGMISSFPFGLNLYAWFSIRFMTPLNSSAYPIGIVTGAKLEWNSSVRLSKTSRELALSLSILLMKTALGLFLVSSLLQSLMVSIWAPSLASTSIRAASADLKEQIASPMKSAVPGVSRMLILLPIHSVDASAVCTEIFLAISSSVKSLVVFPPATASAFGIAPV